VRFSFDSKTIIYCWSILSDGDNMTGDKDSTGNGAGKAKAINHETQRKGDPKFKVSFYVHDAGEDMLREWIASLLDKESSFRPGDTMDRIEIEEVV